MSFIRLCTTRLIAGLNGARNGHQMLGIQSLVVNQCKTMIGVERMDPEVLKNKRKPWPYKTKPYYTYWHYLLDLDITPERFDQNTKIVVIEGNKASGKEVVAQALAKEFGLLYLKEPDLEEMYINHNGFDYRSLNKYIDELVHAIDEKMFYENPHHKAVQWLKMFYYYQRFEQYIDALVHLYATGQGIVLERSPYSDFVFTDAMHKCGFLNDDTRDFYFRLRHNTIYDLQRPHLVIYLDVSPEECLRRIKARNIPHEVNSKVLTKEYLQEIENQYKKRYLQEASRHSEVLIYDWNKYGDIDDVVDDIEKIKLDEWDPHLEKFEDWNLWEEDEFEFFRNLYTNKKYKLMQKLSLMPVYDVPSLWVDDEIGEHRDKIYKHMVPNYGITPSFDPSKTSLLTRLLRWRNTSYKEDTDFNCRGPFY
ncbi:NADH dehydrogenase [ubiquinone] 1 alpha subcomplex subunit 10, mitochondrial-like [Oppia nitens]|uniref:NADH dehydrogenase [ubiquinone] 1 alpha subcomplex subunit 10, mitochondrial-like n=1 Tax=Oppia nitens TaxID=1686743 RepID=UPI0023DB4F2C|nr:NADH dehydrogenase [ubiquinone] 1 alpha subcomplex subunit 10, mitochondrial-like [Oppia nitens]